jgi:hypothetical protein
MTDVGHTKPSSRTKVRDYRIRKKHGLCVLKITAYEYGLLEYLIESGRLTVADALDRRRVEHAVSEVLAELAARWA